MQAENADKTARVIPVDAKIIIVDANDDSGISSASSGNSTNTSSNNSTTKNSALDEIEIGEGKNSVSKRTCIIEFQALNNRTESTFMKGKTTIHIADFSTINGQRTLIGTVNSDGKYHKLARRDRYEIFRIRRFF